MTDVVKALVLSLLQRWDANPQRLTGLISQAERDAILSLVENDDASPTTPDQASVPSPAKAIEINRTAIERQEVEHQEITLCFDFGTARSKAFAVAANGDDDEVDLVEVPLGGLDNDIDGSVYAISSSVWIDETGLVFVGSEAIRRSQATVYPDSTRARIDSPQTSSELGGFRGVSDTASAPERRKPNRSRAYPRPCPGSISRISHGSRYIEPSGWTSRPLRSPEV